MIAYPLEKGKSANYSCLVAILCQHETPPLESILGLDFNEHGKTLYYSILCPFCYTVGVSHFLLMEGFPYVGYVGFWEGPLRVSQYGLYKNIVFITHFHSGLSIIYVSVA